jgi:hypothetical protein
MGGRVGGGDGGRRRGAETGGGLQVETSSTVGGWLLGTLHGGLNYQIEHHLFPRYSHAHYPVLAAVVRQAPPPPPPHTPAPLTSTSFAEAPAYL